MAQQPHHINAEKMKTAFPVRVLTKKILILPTSVYARWYNTSQLQKMQLRHGSTTDISPMQKKKQRFPGEGTHKKIASSSTSDLAGDTTFSDFQPRPLTDLRQRRRLFHRQCELESRMARFVHACNSASQPPLLQYVNKPSSTKKFCNTKSNVRNCTLGLLTST